MKIRSSTKISVGFVLVVTLGYGGYRFAMEKAIEGTTFNPVVPANVNLVGIDPGAGYKIIVANQVAQLIEGGSGGFGASDSGGGGPTEGAIKKRIPIKEMLAVLRGDESALGPLTMTMNDMKEESLPPHRVMWTAADLDKAIKGDAKLKAKLESDLNVHLDGSPLDKVRPSSIEDGIVIDAPIRVTVNLNGTPKEIVGHVLEPFKPRLIKAVESRYADKNYNRDMQAGYYAEEGKKVLDDPKQREDVAASLMDRVSEKTSRQWAEPVNRVLRSATVVVNDSHITKASERTYDTSDGKRSDLTIELTDEGRRRLWKYSIDKVNTQLLLIANNVAIEAPKISHVLSEDQLTITQMRDKSLVDDAVDMINHHTSRSSNP
jgi:hypothetical protein